MREDSWRISQRSGRALTLIEVVAAIALSTMLLVLLLEAQRSLTRQSRQASLKAAALDAAERLLIDWHGPDSLPPLSGSGYLDSQPRLHWRVTEVSKPVPSATAIRLVRLEVSQSPASQPLASVDVLTTVPQP